MARITAGNRLYLYGLFKRELGTNRQERVSRFAAVLEADGVTPLDFECESADELLSELPEMVKLTVFKKGRSFGTLLANDEYEELLAALQAPAEKPAQKGRSWKHKKTKKLIRPEKPRHREPEKAPVAEVAQAADEAEPTRDVVTEAADEAGPARDEVAEAAAPAKEVPPEPPEEADALPSDVPEPGEEAATEPPEPQEQASEQEIQPDTPDEVTDPAEPPTPVAVTNIEPTHQDKPAPTVSLTITYTPGEDAYTQADGAKPHATHVSAPAPKPATPPPADLPPSISRDVRVGDVLLSRLYQLFPMGVDVLRVLDEDWGFARSLGLVGGNRSLLTFPLRYLEKPGGSPVTITLRHVNAHGSAKKWVLDSISLDAATEDMAQLGPGGLPTRRPEAWTELLPLGQASFSQGPGYEFALFAQPGPRESYLKGLALLARPERWDLPGQDGGYGILWQYLSTTFHRARKTGGLAVSPDGSFQAFDTGLLTPGMERIYALFGRSEKPLDKNPDTPCWKALGFCGADKVNLGRGPEQGLSALPPRVTYLEHLGDVCLDAGKPLGFKRRSLAASLARALPSHAPLEGDEADAFLQTVEAATRQAVCQASTSYRTVVPAYEPVSNSLRLLLPLGLEGPDAPPGCALVLEKLPEGGYAAVSLMSMTSAYVCSRIICEEQPGWLRAIGASLPSA